MKKIGIASVLVGLLFGAGVIAQTVGGGTGGTGPISIRPTLQEFIAVTNDLQDQINGLGGAADLQAVLDLGNRATQTVHLLIITNTQDGVTYKVADFSAPSVTNLPTLEIMKMSYEINQMIIDAGTISGFKDDWRAILIAFTNNANIDGGGDPFLNMQGLSIQGLNNGHAMQGDNSLGPHMDVLKLEGAATGTNGVIRGLQIDVQGHDDGSGNKTQFVFGVNINLNAQEEGDHHRGVNVEFNWGFGAPTDPTNQALYSGKYADAFDGTDPGSNVWFINNRNIAGHIGGKSFMGDDNNPIIFGRTARGHNSAGIWYDGVDFNIHPQLTGDGDLIIHGNLLPGANDAYNFGSDSLRWAEGFFIGGSINLGELILSDDGSGGLQIVDTNFPGQTSSVILASTLFTGPGSTGGVTSVSGDETKFLRGDGTFADAGGGGSSLASLKTSVFFYHEEKVDSADAIISLDAGFYTATNAILGFGVFTASNVLQSIFRGATIDFPISFTTPTSLEFKVWSPNTSTNDQYIEITLMLEGTSDIVVLSNLVSTVANTWTVHHRSLVGDLFTNNLGGKTITARMQGFSQNFSTVMVSRVWEWQQ